MVGGVLGRARELYKKSMPESVRRAVWVCRLAPNKTELFVAAMLHVVEQSVSRLAGALPRLKGTPVEQLLAVPVDPQADDDPQTYESSSLYSWHSERAIKAYQNLDTELALAHLKACIAKEPDDWFKWHIRGQIYLQVIGDLDEAIRQFTMARRIRERLHSDAVAGKPYRFFDPFWGYQIGHIANMEHLIKREILLGRDPKNLFLYFPKDAKPGNRALLAKMAERITFVSDEKKLPISRTSLSGVMEEYYICESLDGSLKHWWHASPEIFEAWERAGRKPLLSLTEKEKRTGRKNLRRLGLPDGAWFVPLHVRESGFKADQGYGAVEQVLNGEIANYKDAIEAVVERGGWVIRIGDSRMKPLPPMRNVIDYALSAHKSDEMDLYILASGRFYIGTSSGPAYVPPLFGIPCVLTNWAPAGQRPFNARDLYILKTYSAPQPGASGMRPLKFAEFLAPPVGYAASSVEARSLTVVPNTPEEIREVVVEMLDRLEGRPSARDEVAALQARFDDVASASRCIGNAQVGAAFLRRYADRL